MDNYRPLRCFWCGADRYRFDDHWLWCSQKPSDAIQKEASNAG